MKYKIAFDKKNKNCIIIRDINTNKIINMIATPPKDQGCDIISFGEKLHDGYNYDFDGLIIITNKNFKTIIYKGEILDTLYFDNNKHIIFSF